MSTTLIQALDLDEVNILGHSMGSSVIWNYYDMYGPERLSKLLLIDQMPMITSNPAWSEQERIDSGAIFNPQSLYETINALAGPDGVETTKGFIGGMLTKSAPQEEKDWIIERNLTMPRQYAATLLYNHSTQDWRDLIPRLELPTLVVGGRVSTVPWQSQEWIAKQIPGARLEIFEEEDGGNHFMFIEGHEKFNRSSPTSWAEHIGSAWQGRGSCPATAAPSRWRRGPFLRTGSPAAPASPRPLGWGCGTSSTARDKARTLGRRRHCRPARRGSPRRSGPGDPPTAGRLSRPR